MGKRNRQNDSLSWFPLKRRASADIGYAETIYPNGLLLFRQDLNSDQRWPWEIHGRCDNLGFPWERLADITEIQIVNNRKANSMDLEQHHIIKFSRFKGLKLGEIAEEPVSAYGPDAYTPPSRLYWLHQIRLGRTDLGTQHAVGRPSLGDIDADILSILGKYPFFSVRTIAGSLGIPVSTIYFHLVEKIGFKIFFLRWFSHTLTRALQQKRVELSSQ
jgi:hypothetical protein